MCLLLTSCFGQRASSFEPFVDYVNPFEQQAVDEENYYRLKDYLPLTYKNKDGETTSNNTFNDVFRSYSGNRNEITNLKSTSDNLNPKRNILVVPLEFSDLPVEQKEKEKCTIDIQNAFFGKPSNTAWESVASFYNKSSYGNLKLGGEVTPWYSLKTYQYHNLQKTTPNDSTTSLIAKEVLEWFKETYPEKIKDYDLDKDGYFDALYIIYHAPYTTRSSIFWAYTTFMNHTPESSSSRPKPNIPDLNSPVLNGFSWSSYDFLISNNKTLDTRTYIHEMGHIFGLDDYYNTSLNSVYGPIGKTDMMDYSIGDHSVFSKMLLNWTRPYVVKDEGTITIKPFEENGDCILIPKSNYNGSALDEYILLEFYSPSKLNYYNSINYLVSDDGKHISMPSKSGIRVYHVDARLGYFEQMDSTIRFQGYIDDENHDFTQNYTKVGLLHSNSFKDMPGYNGVKYPLYHLLEKNGENTFVNGNTTTNEALFYEGDSFGINTFKNYQFHNGFKYNESTYIPGESLNYSFSIEKISNSEAVINFIKL